MAAPRLILVDGSAYIFRAFHALPPMNRKDGTPVNAVFGFTGMVMKLIDDEAPDYTIVVLDQARETFRNEIYPEYKANRSAPPEELIPQFPLIREATRALNLPVAEMAGFEADDLIATYARLACDAGIEVVIVSSDKDLMQLIRPGVTMLDPMKQKRIGRDEVIERFGVPPEKVVDVQALAGDPTDNVPGVPGIGVKTAAELINTYGSLDDLLDRAGEITQPKRRENLQNHAEMARVSRQLVHLRDDAPLPLPIEDAKGRKPQAELLRPFLEEQGFRRLLARLEGDAAPASSAAASAANSDSGQGAEGVVSNLIPAAPEDITYTLITDEAALTDIVAAARMACVVAVDTETTSLTASAAELVGISLAWAAGQACYIPLRHGTGAGGRRAGSILVMRAQAGLANPLDRAIAILRPLFEDPAVLKVGHNLKYDSHVLSRQINGAAQLTPIDDTMCLSFVLDAGRQSSHKLDDLAEIHLGHSMIKYEDVCGKGTKKIGFNEVDPMAALDYAAEDADITLRLWQMLKPRLAQEGKARVYERLERPLIAVLAAMEAEGIKVDRQSLSEMSQHFAARMVSLKLKSTRWRGGVQYRLTEATG